MRRDPRLVRYSREHHAALRLARNLAIGDPTVATAVGGMQDALRRHFAEEEQDLIPQLDACGEPALIERLRAEHVTLGSLLSRVADGAADLATLRRLGQLLEAHVRFEERELFAALERQWVA